MLNPPRLRLKQLVDPAFVRHLSCLVFPWAGLGQHHHGDEPCQVASPCGLAWVILFQSTSDFLATALPQQVPKSPAGIQKPSIRLGDECRYQHMSNPNPIISTC